MVAPPFAGQDEFIPSLNERLIHVSIKDSPGLYAPAPLADALQLWQDEASLPTDRLREMKKTVIANVSLYDRLKSPKMKEQMIVSQYFTRMISLDDLKCYMATVVTAPPLFNMFIEAIEELRKTKPNFVSLSACTCRFVCSVFG